MFSLVLFRFSKPNSCLLLLFFLSCFLHLSYARSQQEGKLCNALYECGNLTAGFPFWGEARPQPCGHPSLWLQCNTQSNWTSLIISGLTYRVLDLNITTSTLRLVRQDFSGSFCSATFSGATLTPELFQLLPNYKTLSVYFICRSRFYYSANFRCSNTGLGSMHQDDSYHKNCDGSFNITVPKGYAPEEKALNVTKLESVLKKGFEVKLSIDGRPCQECKSAGGYCGYDVTTQVCCKRNSSSDISCTPMIPSKPSVSQHALKRTLRNQSLEAMKDALNEGFTLRVNSECSQCFKSKGSCGYNKSLEEFICYCKDEPHRHTCDKKRVHAGLSRKAKVGIGFACGFFGATLIIGYFLRLIIPKRGTSHHPRHHNLEVLEHRNLEALEHHNLEAIVQLKQYTYEEVKKITKSFSYTVGKGGFGIVYGGNLCDGHKVAVKILKDSKSSGEDFINEVASMSQTSHVNIVSLFGFCYEGSKRAIIYEFLENGSLDQFILGKNSLNLDVSTLYGIALGVARGIEYLHYGCKTKIVHFDIKPQNVLLDENLCPKVSDFGLAKLCEKRESILSSLDARGTIGYIAPEVFSRMYGRVSHKSDVYSYGMLVLEIIGERNKEPTSSNSSSAYFPDWIYKDLENGEYTLKYGDEITTEEKEIAKKMILVGLWCIQQCPSNRPPMNKVVEMMEGSLDVLEFPPSLRFIFLHCLFPNLFQF